MLFYFLLGEGKWRDFPWNKCHDHNFNIYLFFLLARFHNLQMLYGYEKVYDMGELVLIVGLNSVNLPPCTLTHWGLSIGTKSAVGKVVVAKISKKKSLDSNLSSSK
jgi:hypothetical protein